MTGGSPHHQEGEKDLGDKKDNDVYALRLVDDGASVRDLGLTLSPGSQVQRGAGYEYKYDAESPLVSSNGNCGRSPPLHPGICSNGSGITGTALLDELIGGCISGSCECTESPNYDSDLDSTKMDAGSMHNVQPGATVEHNAPGALVDRRTKQLLSKEQALQRYHHQVIEHEKQVQAQARSHAVANEALHNENQALRNHVAQLKRQFETIMHAQAQAHQHAAMIDQPRSDNRALHAQVAQLKNELAVNTQEYHHSYRQLQYQSENEKRHLQRKQAAVEAELNQYKSATTMFSGMSVVEAQRGVMKLRQDAAQAIKARQYIMKTANDTVKKNIALCQATVDQAKDTIARLTRERNELEATSNALFDMLPTADAKVQEISTKKLLASAKVGLSQTNPPMMACRNAGNHMMSTKDLLASFRPNIPNPAQNHVTIDLTGEYPGPADTPATRNMSTTYTSVASPPVTLSFDNAVQDYRYEAQAQFAPDFNMYGLFPGASQLSNLPFDHNFLTTHTSLAQSSNSPVFDSALQTQSGLLPFPVAPDGSGLLETNSTVDPFPMSSTFNITAQTPTEVAASLIAPAVSHTVETNTAGARFPTLFTSDVSTEITISQSPARTESPFTDNLASLLAMELEEDAKQERAEAEAVAEAEAAWIPHGYSDYLNGELEQVKESFGDNVKGYRRWLFDRHAQRKRDAKRELGAGEREELAQLEKGQAESDVESEE